MEDEEEDVFDLFSFHQNILFEVPKTKNHPQFFIIEGYHDKSGSGAGIVHIQKNHPDIIEELLPNESENLLKFSNILGNIMSNECEGYFSNLKGNNTGFVWEFNHKDKFIKGGLSKTEWNFFTSNSTEKQKGFVLIQANLLEKKNQRIIKFE